MEKIENKKLTPKERIERKSQAEAQAKAQAQAKARETAEESIATAFETDQITGKEATQLFAYIETLTSDVLVDLPDVGQMMIRYRAAAEAKSKAADPKWVSGGKNARRSDFLASVSAHPGAWTEQALADEADMHYPHGPNHTSSGETSLGGMISKREIIAVQTGRGATAYLFPVVLAKSLPPTDGRTGRIYVGDLAKIEALRRDLARALPATT
jgi:hypothetical protein